MSLRDLLDDLYAEGQAFDATRTDREDRRRNLEPAAAEVLTLLLRAAGAASVVEIGTSNGYSALWLAGAARATGGTVVSVDVVTHPDVSANLARAGLADLVTLSTAGGGPFLAARPDHSVDLLFLDAHRPDYEDWWPDLRRVLRPGGVLAIDNVLSHPGEVSGFLGQIAADPSFTASTVAVGKGLHVAIKDR